MISRSTAVMSRISYSEDAPSPEEQCAEILNSFHSFDRSKSSISSPKRRAARGLVRTNKVDLLGSPRPWSSESPSEMSDLSRHHCRTKSLRSKSTAVTSSLSTEADDDSPVPSPKAVEEIDTELSQKNRELKRELRSMERNSTKGDTGHVNKATHRDAHILKLTEKAKALKMQYKDERRKAMRLEKHLHAHNVEIEGLQRELSQALDMIDSLEQDRASEREQLLRLTFELEEWRQKDGSTPAVKRLESQLRERNDELSMTLEMLESKAKRNVELENELRAAEHKLRDCDRLEIMQHGSFEDSHESQSMSDFSSMDLQESRAECKRLKRQNFMLRLLLQELEESRKGEEEGDLDSIFGKSAVELGVVLSARDELPTNLSSQTGDELFQSPVHRSPTRRCPSPVDDSSTDASSARAEALFQNEIERFNLEGSNSSLSRSQKSLRSPRKYLSKQCIHPYDI